MPFTRWGWIALLGCALLPWGYCESEFSPIPITTPFPRCCTGVSPVYSSPRRREETDFTFSNAGTQLRFNYSRFTNTFRQAIPPSCRFPPSTGGTEKIGCFPTLAGKTEKIGCFPTLAGKTEKIGCFPTLAGGTLRRGVKPLPITSPYACRGNLQEEDETLAEEQGFASENEPILCTFISHPFSLWEKGARGMRASQEKGAGGMRASQEKGDLILHAGSYHLRRSAKGELYLELSGNVVLEYQGRTLSAEVLTLDTERTRVLTEGAFLLSAPEGTIQGIGIEYDYETGRGLFRQFRADVLRVIVQGELLEGDLNAFTAQRVLATTCERTPPDYALEADSIRLSAGARLRLQNVRVRLRGKTLLTLPQAVVRVRETTELVDLPSPTYSPDTGWGVRSQVELPLGRRVLGTLAGSVYLRDVPETRLVIAYALRGEDPRTTEPELRARFEASPLYNLRLSHTIAEGRLRNRTPTLRIEQSVNVRPLFAPAPRTRISRSELAFDLPVQMGSSFGVVTLRMGSQGERVGTLNTPRQRRIVLEAEWLQPLWQTETLSLQAYFWASRADYAGGQRYEWFRPQIALRWQPSSNFALMTGYAFSRVGGTTPFLSDTLPVRHEWSARAEWVQGNLRFATLLVYDTQRSRVHDVQAALGWRIHCLEPYLFWRRSPSSVLLGVNLTAFQ